MIKMFILYNLRPYCFPCSSVPSCKLLNHNEIEQNCLQYPLVWHKYTSFLLCHFISVPEAFHTWNSWLFLSHLGLKIFCLLFTLSICFSTQVLLLAFNRSFLSKSISVVFHGGFPQTFILSLLCFFLFNFLSRYHL